MFLGCGGARRAAKGAHSKSRIPVRLELLWPMLGLWGSARGAAKGAHSKSRIRVLLAFLLVNAQVADMIRLCGDAAKRTVG